MSQTNPRQSRPPSSSAAPPKPPDLRRPRPNPPTSPQPNRPQLDGLGRQILDQWESAQPQTFKRLGKTYLHQAAYEAQERAGDLLIMLINQQGLRYDEAMEVVWQEVGWMPDEETEDEEEENLL